MQNALNTYVNLEQLLMCFNVKNKNKNKMIDLRSIPINHDFRRSIPTLADVSRHWPMCTRRHYSSAALMFVTVAQGFVI